MPILDLNGDQFHYHVDDFSDPWRRDAPILLHHAAGGNLHRWRPWAPTLARHRPVVRFDMRGHAGTRKSLGDPFDLADLAADIARVLDALDIDRTHLVGASAGGIVSLQFAHDHPDRLLSLDAGGIDAQVGPDGRQHGRRAVAWHPRTAGDKSLAAGRYRQALRPGTPPMK